MTDNNTNTESEASDLLNDDAVIINVGLQGFADELSARGTKVIHVDWRPPAAGDAELAELLSRMGS